MMFATVLVFTILFTNQAHALNCSMQTYGDETFQHKQNIFLPVEKVYVKIRCEELQPGTYDTHINWIIPNVGIIRTDSQSFEMKSNGDKLVLFWMKLSKNSLLNRTFSTGDYKDEYYGDWILEAYVNDVAIVSQKFVIK